MGFDGEARGSDVRNPNLDWPEALATAIVTPMLDDMVGSADRSLMILLGAVLLVLLIACLNVANLMLARGEGRRRELAIRNALGAGRLRMLSQSLFESLSLGLVGGDWVWRRGSRRLGCWVLSGLGLRGCVGDRLDGWLNDCSCYWFVG